MLLEGGEILFRVCCRTGSAGKINGFLRSTQLLRGRLGTACYDDHRHDGESNNQPMLGILFQNDTVCCLYNGFHTARPMHRGCRS